MFQTLFFLHFRFFFLFSFFCEYEAVTSIRFLRLFIETLTIFQPLVVSVSFELDRAGEMFLRVRVAGSDTLTSHCLETRVRLARVS